MQTPDFTCRKSGENHYAFNPEIPEESRQIRIQSRENMQKVYESLKDNPQIRWKDSVQKLLGITQTGENNSW